jgi:hypothetical protein
VTAPLPCDEPAPGEPDPTQVARWLSRELGRMHDERDAAHREAALLSELLTSLARQAEPRLSVTDADRLRGIRARADALAARLAAPVKPRAGI